MLEGLNACLDHRGEVSVTQMKADGSDISLKNDYPFSDQRQISPCNNKFVVISQ